MLRTGLIFATICAALIAALFLAAGGFGLSAERIALLSQPHWDSHPGLVASLSEQRAFTWAGAFMLAIVFMLQLVNALWPLRYVDMSPDWRGALVGTVAALLIGFAAYLTAVYVGENTARKVQTTLDSIEADQEKKPPPS